MKKFWSALILGLVICILACSYYLYDKSFYELADDRSHLKLTDLQIMEDISILIPSCDKYSELWDVTVKQLLKNWPNLDDKLNFVPIYLISNQLNYENPRITNLRLGIDRSWSDNMIFALRKIKTKYILLILDDYIITQPVNEKRFIELFRYLIQTHAPYISIDNINLNEKRLLDGPMVDNAKHIRIRNRKGPYKNSTQVSIIEKGLLLELLVSGESAWDYEINGSKRTRKIKRPFLITIENSPFHYLNAVEKKIYRKSVVDYLRAEGQDFKPGKMPIDPAM